MGRTTLAPLLAAALLVLALSGRASADRNDDECANATTCKQCVAKLRCVWCGESNSSHPSCAVGLFYGPEDRDHCPHWRWGQCKIDGLWALIGTGSLIGATALLVCATDALGKYAKLTSINHEDEVEPLVSTAPVTKAPSLTEKRREEMRAKWGALTSTE
eukprot:m51a1_g772 hypothetical protein (160) ;mRNA; f:579182-580055